MDGVGVVAKDDRLGQYEDGRGGLLPRRGARRSRSRGGEVAEQQRKSGRR